MLFWVWVCACVPFVCVMAVGVGVSGFWWCVFQWCVAVVLASRRVPGVGVCVSWLVSGVCLGVGWLVVGACGLVWACSCVPVWSGVGVLFSVVAWLVWFRMLTCLASFLSFCFLFLLVVWLITVWWLFGVGWCVCLACWRGESVRPWAWVGVFVWVRRVGGVSVAVWGVWVVFAPVRVVWVWRGRSGGCVGYWVVVLFFWCALVGACLFVGCVSVGCVWRKLLFGLWVCCSGWRVACVAS